jgi:hypothetical protein
LKVSKKLDNIVVKFGCCRERIHDGRSKKKYFFVR